MTNFQDDARFRNQIFYALKWAEFLRHNIDGPLIPFMFMYDNDKQYTNMLQPGGDPEEFAYRVARNSDRKFDSFVIGYEGKIGISESEKQDAILIKGYKLDKATGVFLGQMFKPMETFGKFELVDDPILIDTPKLPLALSPKIEREEYQDVVFNGIVAKNDDLYKHISFYTHDNPAAIVNTMIHLIRSKISNNESAGFSGDLELAINPENHNIAFLKHTVIESLKKELAKKHISEWENKTGRELSLTVVYGDEKWAKLTKTKQEIFDETKGEKALGDNEPKLQPSKRKNAETMNENSGINHTKKDEDAGDQENYLELYENQSAMELKREVNRIRSIPNARTNVDCLKRMTALMDVMEKRGIDLPGQRSQSSYAERKQNEAKEGSSVHPFVRVMSTIGVIILVIRILRWIFD